MFCLQNNYGKGLPIQSSMPFPNTVCTTCLSLAEGLDIDDIVQLLGADDSLHVEHLAANAVHQHREEVGVGEVQGALTRKGIKRA